MFFTSDSQSWLTRSYLLLLHIVVGVGYFSDRDGR